MKIYSVILLMLQTVFLTLVLIVGQVNAQEIADNASLDTKDGQEQATDSGIATDVIEALRKLRETSEKAQKKAKEVLATDKAGNLKTIEAVRNEFTNVINGIRNELKLFKPGSDLFNTISDLKVLADSKSEELKGDDFNKIIKGWKDLSSTLDNVKLQIKDNREKLYEQLTHIVRKEQVIIEMKVLERTQAAIKELEGVVTALKNVRKTLKEWTKTATDEILEKNPEKSPQ
ncbi:hypothetical protein [Candidatus Parabeggiatoa sp. HSG14]|uniref:hypothetical protein n=1 Tax=Candidatus Parabeggiatoa sp. HSG14 TaxID=3055593 RepID=UPI0025A7D999|nr:hypothetical protein [Thiotrichales bacterium HSG14]